MKGLGGLRHTTKASSNTTWRNAAFRGFADYMQTTEFAENIEQLSKIAAEKRTAIMCAEAVPWRCHRPLIGDALLGRNVPVVDIMNEKVGKSHVMTAFAHQGFISRTLLKSTEGSDRYAAVVEHESKETFMAMHLSDERQMLFKKVETLIDGMPEPHFYEVVASRRQ
jgi:uncharacterized protein (DUF488 family)